MRRSTVRARMESTVSLVFIAVIIQLSSQSPSLPPRAGTHTQLGLGSLIVRELVALARINTRAEFTTIFPRIRKVTYRRAQRARADPASGSSVITTYSGPEPGTRAHIRERAFFVFLFSLNPAALAGRRRGGVRSGRVVQQHRSHLTA